LDARSPLPCRGPTVTERKAPAAILPDIFEQKREDLRQAIRMHDDHVDDVITALDAFGVWRDRVAAFCARVEDALGPIDVDEPIEIHDLRREARAIAVDSPDDIEAADDTGPALRALARLVEDLGIA